MAGGIGFLLRVAAGGLDYRARVVRRRMHRANGIAESKASLALAVRKCGTLA